jgi:hypothetical protein
MSSTGVNDSTTDGPHTVPLAEDRKGSSERSTEDIPEKQGQGEITFPEGGLRAWLVAIGCALVLFSTFGYVNAFG